MDYMSVSVPRALMDRTSRLIRIHPELGYATRAAFVTDAIRRWLDREEERVLSMLPVYQEEAEARRRMWDFPPRTPRKK